MILIALIVMKNVNHAQKKVLNIIYVYHVIIQINIMENIILIYFNEIYFIKTLHLKIALNLQKDFI